MPTRFLEYSTSQLAQLADYIERQHPSQSIDRDYLLGRLIALLSGVTSIAHHGPIPQNATHQVDQDALLVELAALFLEFAEMPVWPFGLPYASDQRFYRFANAALHPLFGSSEARLRAIAVRWRKLKAAEKDHRPL